MLRFKIYRRIRVWMGARSFALRVPGEETCYILIYSGWGKIAEELKESGYVEEWPKIKKGN